MSQELPDNEIVTQSKEKEKALTPQKRYKIIFHNDDFTSFDIVEQVLMSFYNKTREEAYEVAAKVHNEGKAVVGVYNHDIATVKYNVTQKFIKEYDLALFVQILPE